jgi:hypothetical protein
MSAEKFADFFARTTNRRAFLKRSGVATLAATAGALGVKVPAAKASPHGCGLCTDNVNPTCHPYCSWCWPSCDAGQTWMCCEGYTYTFGGCTQGNCQGGWICSWYYLDGTPC